MCVLVLSKTTAQLKFVYNKYSTVLLVKLAKYGFEKPFEKVHLAFFVESRRKQTVADEF